MMRGHFRREAIWMVIVPVSLVIVASLAAFVVPRLVSNLTGAIVALPDSGIPPPLADISASDPSSFRPTGTLEREFAFRDYVVKIYRDEETGFGAFEILKIDKRVYAKVGFKFQLGSIYEHEKRTSLIDIGRDITGDRSPNLVISEWTGGAHCFFFFYVFDIGGNFRPVGQITAGHSDKADFQDLDGDSNLEFVTPDWTFAYKWTSLAFSPAPEVILRYGDGGYHFAEDLMRKPSPSGEELESYAHRIQEAFDWQKGRPPITLWKYMLGLIYSGHADLAWRFFEMAWPSGLQGKSESLGEFRQQLFESPFWKDIQKINDN